MSAPRRVLVTRAGGDARSLSDPLQAAGLVPVEVALIHKVFHPKAVKEAVAGQVFDWLILTSGAAVDALTELRASGWSPPPNIAAVGPSTQRKAEESGLVVTVTPDKATGEVLAATLGDLAGQHLLYPRAAVTTRGNLEHLRGTGARVTDVVAYRNEPPTGWVDALTAAWPVDCVTLLSGSAARRLVEGLAAAGLSLGDTRVVVIGPSTERAARKHGLPVHAVADPHTAQGVLHAVLSVLERPGPPN